MLTQKKTREFNLEERLNRESRNKIKINIERLPKKKLRPIWWTIGLFLVILYLFYFLKQF